MKRLADTMKKSAEVLNAESKIYHDLPDANHVPKIDIMELYAGQAEISQLAHRYDLRACQPFDLLYGLNLKDKAAKQTWQEDQAKFKPLLVIVEPECAHWNIMNENLNYLGRNRMEELQDLRRDDRPLVKLGVQACYKQIEDGNIFLFENPRGSRICLSHCGLCVVEFLICFAFSSVFSAA